MADAHKKFVEKRNTEEDTAEQAQKKPRRQAIPRMASLSWIRDLDHACVQGVGHGLDQWLPKDPERAFDDELAAGEEDMGSDSAQLMRQAPIPKETI